MARRFNPPPNWPTPPAGWVPPDGWRPDPAWGPMPARWQLWVDDPPAAPPPTQVMPAAQPAPAAPLAQGTAVRAAAGGGGRRRLVPAIVAAVLLALVGGGLTFAHLNRIVTPEGIAASAVDGSSVAVSWDPVRDGRAVERYAILRDGKEVGSVPHPGVSFTDGGLSPSSTYRYAVVSVAGQDRSSPSAEQEASPTAPAPSGLASGEAGITSAKLSWKAPAGAPAPDKYVISRDDEEVGTVEGDKLAFTDSKLTPATEFVYQVHALWGTRASDPTETVTVKTAKPSVSAGRLQDTWSITHKMTKSGGGGWPKVGRTWLTEWDFTPTCKGGACTVKASAQIMNTDPAFAITLKRQGASYAGSTKFKYTRCRGKEQTNTITIRLEVTKAGAVDGDWRATGLKGTLSVSSPYMSVGGGWYCPAQTKAMSVTASNE